MMRAGKDYRVGVVVANQKVGATIKRRRIKDRPVSAPVKAKPATK